MIELPTTDEPVRIIEGDCLSVMRQLPDGCVDAVVTDPPYDARTHKGARSLIPKYETAIHGEMGGKTLVDFASFDVEQLVAVCKELVRVSLRWVVLTCDWRHAVALESIPEFVRLGIWVKPDAAPQFSGDRPATGWEAVAILHRKGRKRWNGGGMPAVWTSNIVKSGNLHRTQKPVKLVRRWVRDFTDPGELVFDPFGGSGTTATACVIEGRRCLTIEREPAYCDIARRRVAEAMGTGLLAGLA